MARLTIDTKKSLYKPIEIEVNGKVYLVKRITRPIIVELDKLAKNALDGDVEAAYKQVELLLGKDKSLDELELREVNEIVTYITQQIFKPEKVIPDEEKKATGPGSNA